MPKLPSGEVLGGLPSGNSGRPIATFNTTAPGLAMESVGKGIRDLGAGIASGIKAFADDQNEMALARAKSGYLTERVKLDEERDDATDSKELENVDQRHQELVNKWGGTLSGRNREKWNLDFAPKVAEYGVNVRDKAFSLDRDKYIADTNDQLEKLRRIGVDPKSSEADRNMAIETGQQLIGGLESNGYISKVDAQGRRQKWVRDYTWDTLRALPAADRIAALGGGATAADVAKAYEGVTESGHADVLMELFRKTGGQVIDPRETAWCAAFVDAVLGAAGKAQKGTLRAADFLNYGTPTDAPSKGDVVVFKPQAAGSSGHVGFVVGFDGKNVRYIAGNDSNKVQETTLPLSEVAGFRVPPEAGKSPLPPGADMTVGERVAKRATDAAKSSRGSQLAGFLAPDDQKALLDESRKELTSLDKQAAAQRKALIDAVSDDVTQDIASIEGTGVGREGLTREKVQAALGPVKAQEWEGNRARARQYFEAFDGAATAPEHELRRRVESLAPKGGSADYIEQQEQYAKALKKRDAIIQERTADPALASERMPAVQAARQAAQYDGEGPTRTIQPASAQAIVSARLSAQEKLGILDPSPITKNEGAAIARQLRIIGEDNAKGLDNFMRALNATYGDYAKVVLATALMQERVNRDLSIAATDVLSSIAQGKVPDPATIQQTQTATDNQRMTDAMSGQVRTGQERRTSFGRTFQQQQRAAGDTEVGRQITQEAAQPPSVTYQPDDLKALWEGRANAEVQLNFDLKYGGGAAKHVLKDLERRMTGKR